MRRTRDLFATVTTEGGLLPSDLLERIAGRDREIDGLGAGDYHLAEGERPNEVVSRSWSRMTGAWRGFRHAITQAPEGDAATKLTRERWLLILFQELGYGRLVAAKAVEIDGKQYPISHFWRDVPIHIVGFGVDLDRRTPGVAGAARSSPHSLLQEYLNREQKALYGFVSNGRRLRVLRDNSSLTRQAFVEFDLEAMMEGEVYADFSLLWLLCHQSRVEAERPEECWLEKWSRSAAERGTRALDRLRGGFESAIRALGSGFLSHPANRPLLEALRAGTLTPQDYHREILRLVYRMIFLFVAEDRGLLLDPTAPAEARERYTRWYSTARLRQLAERRRGSAHADLWQALRVVMDRLGRDEGCPALALPALGSLLWSSKSADHLAHSQLANRDLLEAVRSLAFTLHEGVFRPVDFKNLGADELGSVYESLLELHPEVDTDAGTFDLKTAAGHERKTTGSYYTPPSLVACLLDTALDPILNEAARNPDPERAILSLKVCDPACGSGHFLIAAAHRIAKRLAAIRTGDPEPSPEAFRAALRDVIAHCVYGVDLNEMAVELCKVNLWLESIVPGRPLPFLDHRIVRGNSLLGTTPALIAQGIPDAAFEPLTGDDKKIASALRRQNRDERKGQGTFTAELLAEPHHPAPALEKGVLHVDRIDDGTIAGLHKKEDLFQALVDSAEYQMARLVADAWCAAFVWRKTSGAPPAVTYQLFRHLQRDRAAVPPDVVAEIQRLAREHWFFHWHIAFPDIFRLGEPPEPGDNPQSGWSGGFDLVLGNPPWERVKLQEKEFFAARHREIAEAPNAAARRRLIAALGQSDPPLYAAFQDALRTAEGEGHFLRSSGRYPLCGCGDVNTYAVFAEGMRTIICTTGRVGCIVPSGIATDDTTKFFFRDLIESRSLVSLFSFMEIRALFLDTDSRNPFCLLTLSGAALSPSDGGAEVAFFARSPEEIREETRRFMLSADDVALLNPNTRTCPVFRTRRDAELTKAIYQRVPVLLKEGPPDENPWGVSFMTMFHMANDSGLFRARDQLESEGWQLEGNVFHRNDERFLPLLVDRMIHQFDHRYQSEGRGESTIDEHQDPSYQLQPRYWVAAGEVASRASQGKLGQYLLCFRDRTRPTDARTVISTIVPLCAVGHPVPIMRTPFPRLDPLLCANLNSLALDFVARQKVGGMHLTFFIIKQLPILPPSTHADPAPWDPARPLSAWLLPRVLELTYTAWDLESFARDMTYDGPPFRWDEERRFLLRCELDAAFFHLYGIGRDDVDYIMDTFPLVRRNDEKRLGEYRTKRLILEIYDHLAAAAHGGTPYRTLLDPPPADPSIAHHGRGHSDRRRDPAVQQRVPQ